MKFKLPRQTIDPEINRIVSREVREQKLHVFRANKSELKEIAEMCRAIRKSGLPKHLVCKKLPDGLGYGIFLHPKAKPIEKGEIIAPYSGKTSFVPQNIPDDSVYAFAPLDNIILTKDEQAQFDPERRYRPRRIYQLNVDGERQGNFTRFINHSEKPNIVADLYRIGPNSYGLEPSSLEVLYIASKKIHPGEQLLVCYEGDDKSYWSVLNIKPAPITPKTFRLDSSLKLIGSI